MAISVHATVSVAGDAVAIDFTGTWAQHEGNLNCPPSVARSACFYVVRVLVDPDLPASGGAFAPVTVARAARQRTPAGAVSLRATSRRHRESSTS